jgi:hypothetical protein
VGCTRSCDPWGQQLLIFLSLWMTKRQYESGHFLTYGHFMSRPTALHCRTPDLYWHFVIVYMTYQFKRNPNTIPVSKIICTCTTIFLKFYNKCVIFACQLWPKYDFNADLYLLQRKIWRDKKNINMTMNGGQIRFYLRIYCRTLGILWYMYK